MKKALGLACMNLAGIGILWFLTELVLTEMTGGNFVQNLSQPLFMILGGAAVVQTAKQEKLPDAGSFLLRGKADSDRQIFVS